MSDFVTRLIRRAAGIDDSPRVLPIPSVYSPHEQAPAFSEWEIEDESRTDSLSPVVEPPVTRRPTESDGRRPASAQEKLISGRLERPGEEVSPRRAWPPPSMSASRSEPASRKSDVTTVPKTVTDDVELRQPKRRTSAPARRPDHNTAPQSLTTVVRAPPAVPAESIAVRERGSVATPAPVIALRATSDAASPHELPALSIGHIDIIVAPPTPPALPQRDPRTRGFSGYSRLRRGLQR